MDLYGMYNLVVKLQDPEIAGISVRDNDDESVRTIKKIDASDAHESGFVGTDPWWWDFKPRRQLINLPRDDANFYRICHSASKNDTRSRVGDNHETVLVKGIVLRRCFEQTLLLALPLRSVFGVRLGIDSTLPKEKG